MTVGRYLLPNSARWWMARDAPKSDSGVTDFLLMYVLTWHTHLMTNGLNRESGMDSGNTQVEAGTRDNALVVLIKSHMSRTGESYGAIARRGGLPRQTVQALANRRVMRQTPRPDTLQKLAKGLQLPLATVNQCAAQAAADAFNQARSEVLREDPILMVLIDTWGKLDPAQRQVLIATAEALRASYIDADTTLRHRE
jgi:transcriptional regulator with XRE-family HTH domain